MLTAMPARLGENYSPLYFLAALGAGGLSVSFFMWLMFWIPHPGGPVPTFEDMAAVLASGPLVLRGAAVGAALGILIFAALMARLLWWNVREYAQFRRTSAYAALRRSNNETQLLAIPLTLAMGVNVLFVLGLVFVPGLWSVVEVMFPVALVAFLALGVWALRLMGEFWGRVLTTGTFDCSRNNSFGQLLPAFALSMVGVGLAAPAAMSATPAIAVVSTIAASFFIVTAVLVGVIKLVLGVRAMMESGANPESAPTLWIVVPIVTVVTIATLRIDHGLHAHLGASGGAAQTFTMLTQLLAVQVAFALFGWLLLTRMGYFARFVNGPERSAGSFALICPGVALTVMLHFYLNRGLLGVGVVEKFDPVWFAVTALATALQAATIWLLFRLIARHFRQERWQSATAPAE